MYLCDFLQKVSLYLYFAGTLCVVAFGLPHAQSAANRITSMLNGLGFIRYNTNSYNIQV